MFMPMTAIIGAARDAGHSASYPQAQSRGTQAEILFGLFVHLMTFHVLRLLMTCIIARCLCERFSLSPVVPRPRATIIGGCCQVRFGLDDFLREIPSDWNTDRIARAHECRYPVTNPCKNSTWQTVGTAPRV